MGVGNRGTFVKAIPYRLAFRSSPESWCTKIVDVISCSILGRTEDEIFSFLEFFGRGKRECDKKF